MDATSKRYLDDLQHTKSLLVAKYNELGIEASEDEKYDELVGKLTDIKLQIPAIIASNQRQLTEANYNTIFNMFNPEKIYSLKGCFTGLPKLTKVDMTGFNPVNCGNMGNFCSGCTKLTEVNLGDFNFSNVTMANDLFGQCDSLRYLDLSNCNFSKVTNMYQMFLFNRIDDLILPDNFISSSCTNISSLFVGGTSKELNLKGCDLSNVSNFSYAFSQLKNVEEIDLSDSPQTVKAYSLDNIFHKSAKLKRIIFPNLVRGTGRDITRMFSECTSLEYLDVRSFEFEYSSFSRYLAGAFEDIPLNCTIIVKDDTTRNAILSACPDLTGIKTVAEIEEVE